MELNVSDIGEKDIVKYILSKCNTITPDDTAITKIDDNSNLISTTDMLIQSKHFPKNMTYFQMGFKAVTVNVSDLAAMGAKPLGFLLSIAIPDSLNFSNFKEIIDGVLEACEFYEIPLIGGDTNEASEIIINGTALGTNEDSLMKNTYKNNDLIAITGNIGLAALGFYSNDLKYLDNILKPVARIKEGMILKENGATSATDITDGLASELHEMFNGKGMLIYEDKLNISDEFKEIANNMGLNYLDLIFNFGEDFELIFTIPKDKVKDLEEKLDFIIIGEINDSSEINIKLANGKIKKIQKKGYNHFKKEI
ncbi:MAG: thiamine-phosphate kinase [Methanobrevibacter sp.]|uniref:thiamine-phosphate kinase n=1 Tax=Methanobrevibacter sp. TaxID=66852 RepID=UPI0026E085DE|nr:thiamine-phosphate kinase [Methanobrevibacter sp.]MDO5848678.1 thiamine-phosphate kinase [Methanobrevibacter sp.]